MWQVELDLIEDWLNDLSQDDYEQIIAALEVLAEEGPSLGRPLVDRVKGARHHQMKELRPGSHGRSEIRVLFAFDRVRHAVMLVAGDKQGNWDRWYRDNIPKADELFERHERQGRES